MELQPRQKIQLAVAIGLILLAGGTEAAYIAANGFEDDLVKQIVKDFHLILIMGIGAALAIFGLGRSIQPDKPQ